MDPSTQAEGVPLFNIATEKVGSAETTQLLLNL